MAQRSKQTIFNAALLRTGNTETTTGKVYRAMEANYDEIVRLCFEDGGGAFPFGRARVALTSRSAGEYGFEDSYALPDELIQIIDVFINDIAAADLRVPWETSDGKLHIDANSGTIEIEYLRANQEASWSPSFATAVQRRLEAVIKDVEEETGEAAAKDQDADFLALKAGVKGSKGRSAKPVRNRNRGRLIVARRGYFNGS